jgi:hypothetical protein
MYDEEYKLWSSLYSFVHELQQLTRMTVYCITQKLLLTPNLKEEHSGEDI